MRLLALTIALLLLAGCEQDYPTIFDEPPHRPIHPNTPRPEPASDIKVVMVSEPWCQHCERQLRVLEQMRKSGQISDFDVVNSKNRDYPAKVLPTLYVCSGHGCNKIEGFSDADEILKAAQRWR